MQTSLAERPQATPQRCAGRFMRSSMKGCVRRCPWRVAATPGDASPAPSGPLSPLRGQQGRHVASANKAAMVHQVRMSGPCTYGGSMRTPCMHAPVTTSRASPAVALAHQHDGYVCMLHRGQATPRSTTTVLAIADMSTFACCVSQAPPAAEATAAPELAAASSAEFSWTKQWYPVAVLSDLDPKEPFATKLLGRDLVVWRDAGLCTRRHARCCCRLDCRLHAAMGNLRHQSRLHATPYSSRLTRPEVYNMWLHPSTNESGVPPLISNAVTGGKWRCFEDKCPHRCEMPCLMHTELLICFRAVFALGTPNTNVLNHSNTPARLAE